MFQYQAVQTGQITVTGTATQIVPAFSARSGIVLINTGTTTVYIGENGSVSTTTGYPLLASTSVSFSTTGAVWGITSGGSDLLGFLETN